MYFLIKPELASPYTAISLFTILPPLLIITQADNHYSFPLTHHIEISKQFNSTHFAV